MAQLGHDIELADILDASTNGVVVADKRSVNVYMNKRVRSYFRLSGDEGIGLPVGDLIPQV